VLDLPVFKIVDFLDDLADSLEMQMYIVSFLFKKKRYLDVLHICKKFDLLNTADRDDKEKSEIYHMYSESEKEILALANEVEPSNTFLRPVNPILFVNDMNTFNIAYVIPVLTVFILTWLFSKKL
jgi:hypothetical protein